MSNSCPINFENIDSYVARFIALIVSAFLIVYMVTFNAFILYFLFADLILRLFCNKQYSPLFQVAKILKRLFRMKDRFIDGGAKRLAGYFALLFILLLISGNNLNLYAFSIIVGIIFLFCALLEAFLITV